MTANQEEADAECLLHEICSQWRNASYYPNEEPGNGDYSELAERQLDHRWCWVFMCRNLAFLRDWVWAKQREENKEWLDLSQCPRLSDFGRRQRVRPNILTPDERTSVTHVNMDGSQTVRHGIPAITPFLWLVNEWHIKKTNAESVRDLSPLKPDLLVQYCAFGINRLVPLLRLDSEHPCEQKVSQYMGDTYSIRLFPHEALFVADLRVCRSESDQKEVVQAFSRLLEQSTMTIPNNHGMGFKAVKGNAQKREYWSTNLRIYDGKISGKSALSLMQTIEPYKYECNNMTRPVAQKTAQKAVANAHSGIRSFVENPFRVFGEIVY